MTGFRLGHAGGDDWERLYETCLAQVTPLPDGANFGLIYVTDLIAGELPGILDRLRHDTGIVAWVGSVGMGICATGVEYVDEPAIALLVGALPPGSFRLFTLDGTEPPASLIQPAPGGERLAAGLVHGDPGFGEVAEAAPRSRRQNSIGSPGSTAPAMAIQPSCWSIASRLRTR